MDSLTNIINLLGAPQITWAMIFAILGYLGKTIVDNYAQRHKTISELQAKSGVESEKEQEAVRVSVLSQILLVKRAIGWVCHQFLGHAKNGAEAIMLNSKFIDGDVPTYPIKEAVLGLGSLLAQLNNFRTYQYIRVQNQLSDVDLLKKIDNLEETLSRLGIYRGHQKDLALNALKEEQEDFSEFIKFKKQRGKAPSYLSSTISWAEKLVDDFINAWVRLGNQTSNDGRPTLAELRIDLSEYISKDYRPEYDIKPDVSKLQVSDESIEFLRALTELNIELQTVFTKLDKATTKQKRA